MRIKDGMYSDALLFYTVVKKRIERTLASSDRLKSSEIEQLRKHYSEIEKEAEKCVQITNVLQSFKRTAQLATKSALTPFSENRLTSDSSTSSINRSRHVEIPTEPISVNADEIRATTRRLPKVPPKCSVSYSSKSSLSKRIESKKITSTTKVAKESAKDNRAVADVRVASDLTDVIEAEILDKNPLVQW
ncbi:hypothetical protein GJ496_004733 [Pomphorhynchus laevis]|nr:hypothetical protein GJ496_004733 [Pomphorhynchus laevis]